MLKRHLYLWGDAIYFLDNEYFTFIKDQESDTFIKEKKQSWHNSPPVGGISIPWELRPSDAYPELSLHSLLSFREL